MKTAIYPGSFDPVTYGHIDIIERAAKLFDRLIVLVSTNPTKPPTFSPAQRVDFLQRSLRKSLTTPEVNIEIDCHSGLFIDYFKKRGANVIVKGLRAMSDFEYEFQMALLNKDMCLGAETVFLSANVASMFLSSSAVKQIAQFGGDISAFVPHQIADDITNHLSTRSG
ncbi:MAG: pantetheine-phosphate adenylyltransferase [Oscillospiraceae bacterium]|nr:pantetheine-phosphate adenylyltransferase [Oscillospiraceae bacterium]